MAGEQPTRDLVVQLASAGAGIAIFVTFAGGGVTAARLHALGLPIDSTIAALPQQQILVAGVRVLLQGLLASVLVLGVLWLIGESEADHRLLAKPAAGFVVAALGLVPLLAYTLLQKPNTSMTIVAIVAAVVAGVVLFLLVRRRTTIETLRWPLVAVVAVFGGVLAFARANSPPVSLDFADVQLKDGGRTNGYLLGQSGDVVVLAPDVLDKTIGRTVAIQRDQVIDLRISRVSRPVRPIGPQPVSGFTVSVRDPSEHFIEQSLLRIRLSAQWKYPPVIYRGSVRMWRRGIRASPAGHTVALSQLPQRATLADLNEQTTLFAGRPVITRATVLEATPWQAEAPQTIVFGDPKEPRYLGTCDVSTPDGPGFKPRAAISVEGLVVASGVFVSGGGEQRNRVVMVCEHARLARRARGA